MAATETSPAPAAETTAAAPKAPGVMLPLLAVFILMPALAYGLTTYVLIPKMRGALPTTEETADAKSDGKKTEAKTETKGKKEEAPKKGASTETAKKEGGGGDASFEFKDVIVNLSGALGTRYLKTTFTATGSNAKLPEMMAASQKKMLDVAITVLSARTLNDLDEPTAKNAIREELAARFNQVLGAEMVEEIYFSEFVIQ